MSQWFQQPAGRMHFLDAGPRNAPVLLCVHGNPSSSFLFRSLVEEFSREVRVVAPDHLGCGRSEKPLDWSYRHVDHIENLERLVVSLDLSNITLVMHDWGGAIGIGMARRQPQRIARLVATNTAAFRSTRMPLRIRACRAPLIGPFLVTQFNAFAGLAVHLAVERRLDPATKAAYLAPFDTPAHRIAVRRFVEDIPMSPAHPSWEELCAIENSLANFRDRPVCLIWGERDWCFTPHFRRDWMRHFPHASVHPIEHAGHWVYEDAPEEVQGHLRAFLASSAPATTAAHVAG
ncbi:MAG: alpha/beta fold hydrolase [Planctomycetia bacterium]